MERTADQFNIVNKYDKFSPLSKIRIRPSNIVIELGRTSLKFDSFLGNIISFLTVFFVILGFLNMIINEIEAKKHLIRVLFKNFEVNTIMMKKIRIIQENFNEVKYFNIPDFNTCSSKGSNI